MSKCENSDCTKEATHAVTLNIPAVGKPIETHQPIKMYVGVKLCLKCAREFGKDFTWENNEDLKESLNDTLKTACGSDLDFARSFHSPIAFTNPGYQQFVEATSNKS